MQQKKNEFKEMEKIAQAFWEAHTKKVNKDIFHFLRVSRLD